VKQPGKGLDHEARLERRVARNARLAPERESDRRPHSGHVSRFGGGGINDDPECGVRSLVLQERAQHPGRIGIATCARTVLRVGDHDRHFGVGGDRHRVAHAFAGLENPTGESGLLGENALGDRIRRGVGVGLRFAIGED